MLFYFKNTRTGALISILFVMLIWGSAFTVTKLAVNEVPPLLFAFLRNGVACLVLLPFYISRRKKIKDQLAQLPYKKIFWMGLTGITLFYTFFNISLVYTTASVGSLIQGFIPVAIAIGAVLFLKEKLDRNHLLGIFLCVIGVILVGFVGKQDESGNNILGNILMILSVFVWAIYTLISKSVNERDPILVVSLITFIGTALLLPAVVIELWDHKIPVLSGNAWAAVIYLGVFASALCYILYANALKTLSATQVGSFLNLDPVIGAIIAFIFLKDKITAWQIAGGLLVLAGIWLSSKNSRRER